LINVTPIGMAGGAEADQLSFSEDFVRAAQMIFDVVALPPETPLIRLATKLGRKTISGAEVIALQAAEQFVLYTGVRPESQLVKNAAAFASS
jgi:shikimate 5-dehydrogenase